MFHGLYQSALSRAAIPDQICDRCSGVEGTVSLFLGIDVRISQPSPPIIYSMASFVPHRIRRRFMGYEVKKPMIIPICIINQ